MAPTQLYVASAIAGCAAMAVWFHADRNRIKHPWAWSLGVFLFLALALPFYAVHVRRVRRARQL